VKEPLHKQVKEQPTKEDVALLIKQAIEKVLGVDHHAITPDASLILDLGGNSLDLIELQQTLEDMFHTDPLSSAEEESIKCVNDLIDIFWSRVRNGTATCSE